MKHCSLITFIAFFCSSFTFAQNANPKIRAYYKFINQAELSIVDSNYVVASHLYDKAFALKYPNGKDLYNSFLISYFLLDSAKAKSQFNELAYQGFSIYNIIDTTINHQFFKYTTNQYDSIYVVGKQNRSIQTTALDSIFSLDQAVRAKDWGSNEEGNRQMRIADSINIVLMKNYIAKNGFPSFKQCGFQFFGPMNAETLWYLLWHNRPYKTEIDNLVLKAVLEGDYSPEDWASIIMARNNADSIGYEMGIWRKNREFSANETEEINRKRATIYLEPLADYKKKWTYMKNSLHSRASIFGGDNNSLHPKFIFYKTILLRDRE